MCPFSTNVTWLWPCSAQTANQACVNTNLTSEWRLVGFMFLVCFPAVVGIQVFSGAGKHTSLLMVIPHAALE